MVSVYISLVAFYLLEVPVYNIGIAVKHLCQNIHKLITKIIFSVHIVLYFIPCGLLMISYINVPITVDFDYIHINALI